jgi:sugar lactone lactonase YvrE
MRAMHIKNERGHRCMEAGKEVVKMLGKLEFVSEIVCGLAEGPVWDERFQALYWVDIDAMKVNKYETATGIGSVTDVGQYVGAMALREKGGAILALHHGFYFMDAGGCLSPICDPESGLPDNRFNDGKCDSAGRFWAGTLDMNGRKGMGSLYCVDADLSVRRVLAGVSVSNGIAWSPDNTTMYYIDTPTRKVDAFDFDLDTGAVSNRRTAVVFPNTHGFPDGMTADIEGMLWVAEFGGSRVSRWDPRAGRFIEAIDIPVRKVTSCAFGGADMDELFITTDRRMLTPAEIEIQSGAGRVFKAKTGTTGAKSYRFGG